MTRLLRLLPGADDFLTDRLDPLEQTVEIERVRLLPPVPEPRRPRRSRRRELELCVLLFAAALAAVVVAIVVGSPQLLEAVRP